MKLFADTQPETADAKPETRFEPLAIVGIGCLFPKAAGPGFFWANVKHGVDGITDDAADALEPGRLLRRRPEVART